MKNEKLPEPIRQDNLFYRIVKSSEAFYFSLKACAQANKGLQAALSSPADAQKMRKNWLFKQLS